jgi:TfoX/Sxy family transcriptional regulator of competence genes
MVRAEEDRVQIPKATEDDKTRFRGLVPSGPDIEIKPMFGNIAAFVNGNMFMGLFGSDIGVKLNSADQARLRESGGGPFGPAERPMGGYVSLPETMSADELDGWINSALSYVAELPPKQPKKRKAK